MSIFLMIAGTFYMAMPLTAAASTFYQVHEKYQIKHHSNEVAPAKEEPADDKADGENKQSETVALPSHHANNSPALFEDLLDMRIRLNIKSALADLFTSSSSINETFKEMQEPAADSNGTAAGNTVQQHHRRKQSTLLKGIARQIHQLDRTLSSCERDLMTLVMVYNAYMKTFSGGVAANISTVGNVLPGIVNRHGSTGSNRRRSEGEDSELSSMSSRRSSDQ